MAEIAIAAAVAAAVAAASYTLAYVLAPKPKPVERGRLQGQMQVQDSAYGSMIPWILGGDVGDGSPHGIRVAGNVIFMSEIRKVEQVVPGTGGGQSGGKGGGGGAPQERQISYYVDVGICFGTPGEEAELELETLFAATDAIYDVRNAPIGPDPDVCPYGQHLVVLGHGVPPACRPDDCPPGWIFDGDTCVPRKLTGAIDPAILGDASYDYLAPPDPYDVDLGNAPLSRYSNVPYPNERGEISTNIVAGGYAALRWYPGNEIQEPDPLITADYQARYAEDYALGRDVTPSYLGRAYVVLQNFNISKYGALPNFTAIVRNKNLKTAADILTALAKKSGVNVATELDVTALADKKVRGLAMINRASVKQFSADTLAHRFPFDWTQKGGKLTTVMRGGAAVYDVPSVHLGFKAKGKGGDSGTDTPQRVAVKQKLNEAELPRRVEVKAFNPSKDYEIGTASAKRQIVTSKGERTLEINMALTLDEMREIAQRELDTAWLEERQALGISIPHTYADLVPTDVITVNDGGTPTAIIHSMSIKEITGAIPGSLEVVGVPTDAALYVLNNFAPPTNVEITPPVPATVIGTFIDSQYLRDRDSYTGQLGYYVACTSLGNGEFRGANMWRDRGAGYEFVCNFPVRSTMGVAATSLGAFSTEVDVDLYGDATMESFDSGAVAGGSGWVFCGGEAFQYTTATPVGGFPNRWRLSGLTSRGGKGTAAAMLTHSLGERFVLLDESLRFVAVEVSESGVSRNHKFAASGMGLDDAAVVPYTWSLDTALGLPPPSGITATPLLNKIRWSWNHVPDPNHLFSHYEVYRNGALTTLLYRGDNNYFTEDLQTGVSSYPVFIVTYTKALTRSSTYSTLTYTLPAVPDVTGLTATWDGLDAAFTWTQITDPLQRIVGYHLYSSSNVFLGFADKPPFVVRPITSSLTLKIKAIDQMGNVSTNYGSYTLNIGNPGPPASAATVYDGVDVVTTWPASTSPGVTSYEVQDGSGSILAARVEGLVYREKPQSGVATYVRRVFAVNRVGLKSLTYVQGSVTIPAPSPPASATAAFDGLNLVWTLTASPSIGVTSYRVKDTSGNVLADDIGLQWQEACSAGVATYTRRFYAVNSVGLISTTYTETTFTVPVPNPPTSYGLTHTFEQINHGWVAPAVLPNGLEYEISRDGSTVLARRRDFTYAERGFALSSRFLTRWLRSVNIAERKSGWVTANITISAPVAPTIWKDTSMARPNFLPINVATAGDRSLIKQTILQVRSSGAGSWPAVTEGTSGTRRYDGAPPTLNVDWDAGGAMEFRVAHIDEFTDNLADHVWSTTQTYTFPTFSDGALDPNSNFLRRANWRDPIYTGGGTFTWTTAFKIKWDQPILITGLSSVVSSTGQVTIAANTAGTTLLAGQMLVAVQTLGATTASLSVFADDGTYTPPAETSNVIHRRLFKRNSDNSLATYLGVPIPYDGVNDNILDSRVLIPMLSSFDAVLYNLRVTNANIKDLAATKILVDTLYGRIIFGDYIGSTNFVSHASQVSQTYGPLVFSEATGYADKMIFSGDGNVRVNPALSFPSGLGDYYVYIVDANSRIWGYEFHNGANLLYRRTPESVVTLGAMNCGDTKISIAGGVVTCYESIMDNSGGVGYVSSTTTAAYPIRFFMGAPSTLPPGIIANTSITGLLAPNDGSKVHWKNVYKTNFDANDDLTFVGTAGSWGTAGAFSIEPIPAGVAGQVSFTSDATSSKMLGLSRTDADQSYASIERAWYANSGTARIYESGALIGSYGAYTSSTVFSIRRVGGNIVYMMDGIVKRTTTDPSTNGALYVDVAAYDSPATLKNIRLVKAGAIGKGWQAGPAGPAEFNQGISLLGVLINDIVARSANMFNASGYYYGTDAAEPLLHKATVSLSSWGWCEDDDHYFQIAARWPYQLDPYINVASVTQCECRVLNHFGEEVKRFAPFTFTGDGICAWGKHPSKYAHAELQAIYALKFRNAFGWSQEIYLKAGTLYTSLPTLQKKAHSHLELNASIGRWSFGQLSYGPNIYAGAREPVSNYSAGSIEYRLLGAASWTNVGSFSGYGHISGLITGGLPLGALIEVRVKNDTATLYSNIIRLRVTAEIGEATHPPVTTISVYPDVLGNLSGGAGNHIAWGPSPAVGYTAINLYKNGALLLRQVSPFVSYKDNTVTTGSKDTYWVNVEYAGPTYSAASAAITVEFPPTSLTVDPTNLSADFLNPGSGLVECNWSLNSAVGTVSLDYKIDDGNYATGWTTISLAAGTTYRAVTGLDNNNKNYAFRVRVSDAGSAASNIVFALTSPQIIRDYG